MFYRKRRYEFFVIIKAFGRNEREFYRPVRIKCETVVIEFAGHTFRSQPYEKSRSVTFQPDFPALTGTTCQDFHICGLKFA